MAFARARRTALFGAVAAAAVISGGLTALPAFAAGAAPAVGGKHFAVGVTSPEVTLLPQSSGAQARAFHGVGLLVMPEADGVTGVKVAVDASSLAGVAELSLPRNCSFTDAQKLHASCAGVDLTAGFGTLQFGLRSAASATAGAKGAVVFTVTAANATEDKADDPATTAVTVGDGPDVAVGQLPQTLDLTQDAPVGVNPSVSNLGDRDAQGVTLVLDQTPGYAVGGNHSNCSYGADLGLPLGEGDQAVVCHFDTVVKPGRHYWLSEDLPLSLASSGGDAQDGGLVYGWDTADGAIASGVSGGKPGTGAPLTLVTSPPPASRAAHAVDINYDNNFGLSLLHVVTQDDVAAVAHDVRGTVGTALTASFGVRNAGKVPTRPLGEGGAPTAVMALGLPAGVQVVSAPKGCYADPKSAGQQAHAGELARVRSVTPQDFNPATVYVCEVPQVLRPGQEADFAFRLKPTKPLRAVQGAVVAVGQLSDANVNDKIAYFTVTATAAGAQGSPTPKPSASQSGGSASASPTAGGGLAHTGGGSDALPLVGAGAAAIALGAGAVLVARRRRAGAGSHS